MVHYPRHHGGLERAPLTITKTFFHKNQWKNNEKKINRFALDSNQVRVIHAIDDPSTYMPTRGEHRTRFFVLSCPASSLRPGGRQDRTKTKNASCPTGQDTRTACPVLSSDEHFCPVLPCPASYLRPGGRQDRTEIKNASCPTGQNRTGHQHRLSCALLWCQLFFFSSLSHIILILLFNLLISGYSNMVLLSDTIYKYFP